MMKSGWMSALWIAAGTYGSLGFGLVTQPESSLMRVRAEVQGRVDEQVSRLIPASKQNHFYTELRANLGQGKYADGEFSDYFGSTEGFVKQAETYYVFRCDVSVRVDREPLKKRDLSRQVILEADGTSQLIGRFRVGCKLTQ